MKLMGVPVLFFFINLGFILFASEVFLALQTLFPILLLNAFISIDIVIRPISEKRDEYNRAILIISFLLMPLVFMLPYIEFILFTVQFLTPLMSFWSFIIGTVLLVLGGVLLILSRIQLGRYGGPRIVIEDKHQLITHGVYQFVRHPMYLGFLLLFFGYSLAFGSIVMSLVISISFFLIFKNRMDIEEKLLISEFGEEYLTYMEQTKKLFPFLY